MSRENKLRKLKSRRERGLTRKKRGDEIWVDFRGEPAARKVKLFSMNISFEPIESPLEEGNGIYKVPEEERQRIHGLLYSNPAEAIEPLQKLLAEYPSDTTMTQWLTAALRATARDSEADKLAEENYRAHPKYLFARLDYAHALLQRGRMDEIEEVLGHQYHLATMYPERDTFHISELAALSMFMVEFYIKKGMVKQAEIYVKSFVEIAPGEPAAAVIEKMIAFAKMKEAVRQMAFYTSRGQQ